jgi:hypothetical protein
MMLTKTSSGAVQSRLRRTGSGAPAGTLDRRTFLKRSGLVTGGAAFRQPVAL